MNAPLLPDEFTENQIKFNTEQHMSRKRSLSRLFGVNEPLSRLPHCACPVFMSHCLIHHVFTTSSLVDCLVVASSLNDGVFTERLGDV